MHTPTALVSASFFLIMIFLDLRAHVQELLGHLSAEAIQCVGGWYGRRAFLHLLQYRPRVLAEFLASGFSLPAMRALHARDWTRVLSHSDPDLREKAILAFALLRCVPS